jgi:superfamily II DNA or RNA helicase
MIQLRDYQVNYIDSIVDAFKQGHKKVILCAPTGAGKTVIFSEIVRRSSFRGTSTWILTDRIELFEQTWKALEKVNVVPQLINADTKKSAISIDALINVGMVETIFKRKGIKPPQLIICDEAHMGNFTKILERFPEAYIIGATATPIGKHFYKYYTSLIQCIDVPALISNGSLAPCKAIEMRGQDFSDLEMKNGEYTDASNAAHFSKPKLYDGLLEQINIHIQQKKSIVYCANIEHAYDTCNVLIAAGYTAKVVTGKTPKAERKLIFTEFKFGQFQFLINVGVATKGYDEPTIEAVIMYLKTTSLIKYLQCVGRGGRPSAETGKKHFVHLDFGENVTYHGLWSAHRNWELSPPKKKKENAAPMKDCPVCSAMVYASVRVCNFCQYEWPEKELRLLEGVAVEVTDQLSKELMSKRHGDLTIKEIKKLVDFKKIKAVYAWRLVRYRGEDALQEYASLCGYSRGWILRQWSMLTDIEQMEVELRNNERIETV